VMRSSLLWDRIGEKAIVVGSEQWRIATW